MTLLAQDDGSQVGRLRDGRVAGVRFDVLGAGRPVTVFAHGLGGSVLETRPLAARVRGTRVLLDFRGHGVAAGSLPLPGGFDYDIVAADLLAVADHTGAERAVGLSLGSGAVLRIVARRPDRFARLVLALPAAIDTRRAEHVAARFQRLAAAIDGGDVVVLTDLLMTDLPTGVRERRGVRGLVARRAALLLTRPAPRPLSEDPPVPDRAVLADVRAPTLVVGQAGDPLHRLDVAADLAAALPDARLIALPEGGVFWTAARQAQQAVAAHLNDAPDQIAPAPRT